jgi:peptide/nickel transport system substrate-binding protein
MARRIRWQILIAVVSSLLVLGLMSYLALTTTAVARPIAGGAYVEGIVGAPHQLNPLISDPARDPASANIQALLFEGLMRTGADGLPEPALAAIDPEIDDTGTVYTFTLRSDVMWHDGTPLTADDVLFTLRAVQNPAFSGDPVAKSVWQNVLLDKIDERRVRCTLTAPFAPFLSLATFPILPAHLLENLPEEQWVTAPFGLKPIGTGPYQLTEISTERALLTANPEYHDRRPLLDTIELRFFENEQAAQNALIGGEITGFGRDGGLALDLDDPLRGMVRRTTALDSYTLLTFNLRSGPLVDQGLRRALAIGLNKDGLIAQALDNRAQRIDTPILPGWWAAAPDVAWPAYDPDRAAETLTSLDYALGPDGVRVRDGQPLALELITDNEPSHIAVAQALVDQWAAIGVQVNVEQLDAPTLEQRLRERSFTMALHSWQRLGPDPDTTFELWHSSRAVSGFNYAGLEDEQIDTLLNSARQSADFSARLSAYAEFQRRWIDLVPSITLYQPLFIYDVPEALGGLSFDEPDDFPDIAGSQLLLGHEDRFRNVARWFLRSSREIRGDLR